MNDKRRNKSNCDLDTYAAVIESMRDRCIARNVNFRGVMIELATTWMSGKVAAAGSVSCPAAATPPIERSLQVRQSIVRQPSVPISSPAAAPAATPASALARVGAGVLLEPARSPAGKVIELLALREQVDAELGRLMAAMGIPMPAVNATSPAAPEPAAAAPVAPAEDPEPTSPRVKRAYKPHQASELAPQSMTAAEACPSEASRW